MIPRRATLLLAAAAFGASTAGAEPVDAVPPALRACASVEKDSERLACYDRNIERLSPEAAAPVARASRHCGALKVERVL